MSRLFESFSTPDLALKNRIVMPPMTRCKSQQPGNIATELMAEYYAQRATAGLIIAEATQVSADAQGYSYTPGIHTQEQVAGWRLVTDKVHQNDGKIFLQMWHTGRMSHACFQQGQAPMAPSAIALPDDITVWVANDELDRSKGGGMQTCTPPREMTLADIKRVQDDFVQAAVNAREAGFDGIELHGANGYLIDQFLRKSSNQRTDQYGGSPANRIRFLLEILQRMSEVFPPERICVRFAPHNMTRGMDDPDTPETVLLVMKKMADLNIGFVHFAEVDWEAEPNVPEEFRALAREIFPNTIIVAGNYTVERADWVLEKGYADLVAFGRPYLANPDLPQKLQQGSELKQVNFETLFGGDAEGYTDY
ncbi:MAG: alkene reductase [Oceanospirillaceae bacterium]|uniref:alkene reductase n=1 Tax=unclassified Thalassolituus TaxID=2624967 RepID=UPI000C414D61|nr:MULTISPECIES: alkene reductase [unclassified Thalassolituus]MAY00850.1 alkene reductase [Oceanospirillaceae bacterium]MBL36672.1 alkene reductase [Oceanospirillaceae bacterium]MBS54456.1 alkene reductase [Oceanospirillaceae bacterium]